LIFGILSDLFQSFRRFWFLTPPGMEMNYKLKLREHVSKNIELNFTCIEYDKHLSPYFSQVQIVCVNLKCFTCKLTTRFFTTIHNNIIWEPNIIVLNANSSKTNKLLATHRYQYKLSNIQQQYTRKYISE